MFVEANPGGRTVGLIKRLNSLVEAEETMTRSKRKQMTFAERERLSPVGSVAEAQAYLPFAVRVPQQLGNPAKVAASPQRELSSGHAAILFQYNEISQGPTTILEQGGDIVATVRGGIQAIVEVSETGAMARWIEGGVLFTVISPSPSRQDVLAIVERV
jgi:hypothetical protein